MLEHIFRQGIEKPSRKDKLAFAAQTGLSYDYIRVWVCFLFLATRSLGAYSQNSFRTEGRAA